MKAPVFLSCSHAFLLLLLLFRFPPYRSPSFIIGGTAGNRLNLHFAPRGQARRQQVDD